MQAEPRFPEAAMTRTSRAIVIHRQGPPEVMGIEDRTLPDPGPGEVLIRHEAIGLNFLDTYQRSGVYPMPVPLVLGQEGAGVVEAVGEGVEHLRPGDRAAYAGGPPGAYAEARVMPAGVVVPLPDRISFEEAAAVMLKGLTVEYLFRRTLAISREDTVLFHAGAGGVGLIACQWARSEGIRLIATAGGPEKCALAREHGAAEVIDYRAVGDVAAEVRRLTGGAAWTSSWTGWGRTPGRRR
jgi:NADPH2:quinone reductase